MKYLFECQWCSQPSISNYKGEIICRDCDSQLIDMDHRIYQTIEVKLLLGNGYTLKQIQTIIEKDNTFFDALKTLVSECNKLYDPKD